jgi:hypothetical protein
MLTKLEELLEEIRKLQDRVTEEVSREAGEFGYSIRQGRVSFEQEVARRHRRWPRGCAATWPIPRC